MNRTKMIIGIGMTGIALIIASSRLIIKALHPSETDKWSIPITYHEPLNIASSADGRIIALAVPDKPIQLLEPAKGKGFISTSSPAPIAAGLSFAGPTHTMAFPVRSARGGTDIQLLNPDLPSKATVQKRFTAPRGCGQVLAFSHSGRLLAATDPSGNAYLWDLKSHGPFRVLKGSGAPVRCIAFSPDDRSLALADEKTKITIWSLANPKRPRPVLTLGPCGMNFFALKFDTGNLVRAICYDKRMRTCDARTGKRIQMIKLNDAGDDVFRATFAANASELATFQIYHFDVSSYCVSVEDYPRHTLFGEYRTRSLDNHGILLSADGKHLLELSTSYTQSNNMPENSPQFDPYTTFLRIWELDSKAGKMHTVPVQDWLR